MDILYLLKGMNKKGGKDDLHFTIHKGFPNKVNTVIHLLTSLIYSSIQS